MKKSIFLFALLLVAIIFNNATIKAESEDFKQIWEIKNYGRAFSHFVNNGKKSANSAKIFSDGGDVGLPTEVVSLL